MRALLLVLLVGCGRPVTPDEGTPGGSFPHADGYDESGHGQDALAEGATCTTCHGKAEGDLVNGAESSAPACGACHDYPHDGALALGATHGPLWVSDAEDCSGCHGESGEVAPADVAAGQCTGCHSGFPHADGFDEASGHGAAQLARGTALSCTGCHGEDGSSQDPACSSCHADYPHASGWADGDVHGLAFTESTDDPACGESCHATDAEDGLQRTTCASCHDVFPHPDGWTTSHPAVAQARGRTACDGCHGDGDQVGEVLPVSCAPACHSEEAR